MERDSIKHSAEGTHWQKKNHKYIRKEGNRYIYPSDLKKLQDTAESRRNAVNNQSSPDYKKISQQKANRSAAANGEVVNPTYNMRDDKGNLIFRYHSDDKIQMPNSNDYKEYSKRRSNETKRKAAAGRSTGSNSQEYAKNVTNVRVQERNDRASLNEIKRSNATYQQGKSSNQKAGLQRANRVAATNPKGLPDQEIAKMNGRWAKNKLHREQAANNAHNQEYAKKVTDQRHAPSVSVGIKDGKRTLVEGPSDYTKQKRKVAARTVDRNTKNQEYAKEATNAQKRKAATNMYSNLNQQYAKSTAQYGPESAKRKLAQKNGRKLLNEQGSYSKNDAQSTRSFSKSYAKNHNMDSYKAENQNLIKNSSKKLKENGYFTVQNGKTVFVPSDKITMKKVSKGRQVIDKIFNKFFKKK